MGGEMWMMPLLVWRFGFSGERMKTERREEVLEKLWRARVLGRERDKRGVV